MTRNSQPFPVARIRKYFPVDVYSIEDGRGNRSAICLFNQWALGSNYTSQFHSNQRQVVELGVNIMATITPKPNKKNTKTAESLQPGTHFKKDEVENLLALFEANAKNEKMDRSKFRDILYKQFELTEDILMDRVFKVFDEDNDGNLNMKEWVCGMSKFLRGTFKEQIDFCFKVYDLNGSGYITREAVQHMLKDCMVKSPTEEDADENVKDLVDQVFKKMDVDHDGKISPLDFKTTVENEKLLLEAFGKCLPGEKEVTMFERMLPACQADGDLTKSRPH